MSSKPEYKLWGGCFTEEPSDVLRRINDSLSVDWRLYQEDIAGSQGWAQELHLSGHLSTQDYQAIQTGLAQVLETIKKRIKPSFHQIHLQYHNPLLTSSTLHTYILSDGKFPYHEISSKRPTAITVPLPSSILQDDKEVKKELTDEVSRNGCIKDGEEDIHSVVERRLFKHAGDAALRLHTARSRNDQTATDTQLWMIKSVPIMRTELHDLIQVLVDRADREIDIILPGYTHLQRAQPIRWSHFLLSHVWSLRDDSLRLHQQLERISRCPLGSGALSGCALSIDRHRLAKSLGFQDVTPNSMFAVSTRDYIVEFLSWATLCGMHLSRIAEDLIIYSSQEFRFVQLSDQFSTGSSLMPQKRNPDGLELVRGAAGILLGKSVSMNCILKGLPSTYNKDLQSDKKLLFECYDQILACLKVLKGTVNTMTVNSDKALNALESSMLATDLAHALVRKGVPFRSAHHVVGTVLRRAATLGVEVHKMPYHEYIAICAEFGSEEELRSLFSWESSVEQYTSVGGTSRDAVKQQITDLNNWLKH